MVMTVALTVVSIIIDAPLREHSDPNLTPNPAKAPWYFLGLQEILHYFPPTVVPDPADQPAGTQVLLEFQGANNNKGALPTDLSTDVNVADGRGNLGFRATFVGNVTTLLLPNFDLIAIPYLRPQGD